MPKKEIIDINNPHDSFFKQAFKRKETLIDLLNRRLPPKLLANLDLHTLKLENSNFIDSRLQKKHSDLVFSLQAKQEKAYIYLLLEHQTKEDKHMMLRVLEYNARIMRQHVTQTNTTRLPNIINLVLYAGQDPYQGPKSIVEAFDNPDRYLKFLKKNIVLELGKQPDKSLLKDKKAALAELILIHSHKRDFYNLLDEKKFIINLLRNSAYAESAMAYIMAHDQHTPKEILDKMHNLAPEKKTTIMNALQKIEHRGRQEGIQLGEKRGRKEGIQLGKKEGIQLGEQKGRQNTLSALVKKGIISQEQADDMLKGRS